jgi:hypothetical protein
VQVGLEQLVRMLKRRQSQLDETYATLVPPSPEDSTGRLSVKKALVNSGTEAMEVHNPLQWAVDLSGCVCVCVCVCFAGCVCEVEGGGGRRRWVTLGPDDT